MTDDRMMREARDECAKEIADDIVAAIKRGIERHGNDPHIYRLVTGAIGYSLARMEVLHLPEIRALGEALVFYHDTSPRDPERETWIIVNTESGDYWSNKQGWVESLSDADQFTNAERDTLTLPIGGSWTRYRIERTMRRG